MKGQADFMRQNMWYIIIFIIGVGAFSAQIFNIFTLQGDVAQTSFEITNQRVINNIELNELAGGAATQITLDNSLDNISVNSAGRILTTQANSESAAGYMGTMEDQLSDRELTDVGGSVCIMSEGADVSIMSGGSASACQTGSCVDGACSDHGSYGLYCQGGVWTREGYGEHCGTDLSDGNAEVIQFNCPDQAYANGPSIGCGVRFRHHCEKGQEISVDIQKSDTATTYEPTADNPITCTGNKTVAGATSSFAITETNDVTVTVDITGPFGTITETETVEGKGTDAETAAGIILGNIDISW